MHFGETLFPHFAMTTISLSQISQKLVKVTSLKSTVPFGFLRHSEITALFLLRSILQDWNRVVESRYCMFSICFLQAASLISLPCSLPWWENNMGRNPLPRWWWGWVLLCKWWAHPYMVVFVFYFQILDCVWIYLRVTEPTSLLVLGRVERMRKWSATNIL